MPPSTKQLTFKNVGTEWVEQVWTNFPDRFTILRVKAEIKSGAGTEVAVSIRERSEPEDSDYIALQYSLVETLDYLERQVVQSEKVRDIDMGKIYVATRCNSGSNTVVVLLEYEAN